MNYYILLFIYLFIYYDNYMGISSLNVWGKTKILS